MPPNTGGRVSDDPPGDLGRRDLAGSRAKPAPALETYGGHAMFGDSVSRSTGAVSTGEDG